MKRLLLAAGLIGVVLACNDPDRIETSNSPDSMSAVPPAQVDSGTFSAADFRRLVWLHFTVLEQNPALAEVVQVELRQGHKFFRGASAHEVAAYFELIGSVLEDGVAAGRFQADLPVKVATKVLFGAMDQMATSWVLGKRGYRLADTADAVATIFLKGVTRDGV